ncbi:MAG TPA: SDR family oxidoreductase [Puia sp.]|nr:SDR family oxidoreductase [Puia sp.]
MNALRGKIAVVTGGNSGIGYSTAKELASRGATVIITGRNRAAVEAAAAELKVRGIVADQSSLTDTDALVAAVKEAYGKVDILFVNAGVGFFVPIEQATEDHYDQIMNVNFKGVYFTLSKFLPILADGAAVTFNSSINATLAMPGSAVYSASKAALNSLVRVAAAELAHRSIRVNAVSPGPIQTPILTKTGMDESTLASVKTNLGGKIPLKRFGDSEEVARLVAFLSGPDGAFITGSDYVIDGGLNLNAVAI